MVAEADHAASITGAPPRDQAFLFADIAGFTALTEAHGDERAADVVDHFCEHARGLLDRLDGEEVKTIGDAIMVRADTAAAAVRFGIDLAHHEMARHEHPMVGVGIAWGAASDRGGDWIGSTVNIAARLAERAEPGEVLIDAAAHAAAAPVQGVRFRALGRAELRGIHRELEIFEARCEDAAAALYVDPVCAMALDPERSHGPVPHRGLDYYFCSEDCLQAFRRRPDAFTSAATRYPG